MKNRLLRLMMTGLMVCLSFTSLIAEDDSQSLLIWSQGNKHFTTCFYPYAQKNGDNFLFSPLSLQMGLSMTAELALQETQEEILDKMVLPKDPTLRLAGAKKILDLFHPPGDHPSVSLILANGAWLSKDIPLPSSFQDFLSQSYQATVRAADFRSFPEAIREDINFWVKFKTFNRMQNLIPSGVIDAGTELVLVNTLYMHVFWEHPFYSDETYKGLFYENEQSTQQVAYMHQQRRLGYLEDAKCVVVELPFKKTRGPTHFSLFVIVPKEEYSLKEVEETLTTRRLDHWLTTAEDQLLDLSLPKFKISSAINAKEVLQNLGMQRPFSPHEAQFNLQKEVVISNIIHNAVFEVDEGGGRGSAGTGVIMGATSCGEIPKEVKVDRPFLIFVADKTSGMVLFAGRVIKPEN